MAIGVDDKFYERADAYINVANEQSRHAGEGKVNASFMFGAARYNAWMVQQTCASAEELIAKRAEMVDHFSKQYRLMVEENMDEHIRNFADYTR